MQSPLWAGHLAVGENLHANVLSKQFPLKLMWLGGAPITTLPLPEVLDEKLQLETSEVQRYLQDILNTGGRSSKCVIVLDVELDIPLLAQSVQAVVQRDDWRDFAGSYRVKKRSLAFEFRTNNISDKRSILYVIPPDTVHHLSEKWVRTHLDTERPSRRMWAILVLPHRTLRSFGSTSLRLLAATPKSSDDDNHDASSPELASPDTSANVHEPESTSTAAAPTVFESPYLQRLLDQLTGRQEVASASIATAATGTEFPPPQQFTASPAIRMHFPHPSMPVAEVLQYGQSVPPMQWMRPQHQPHQEAAAPATAFSYASSATYYHLAQYQLPQPVQSTFYDHPLSPHGYSVTHEEQQPPLLASLLDGRPAMPAMHSSSLYRTGHDSDWQQRPSEHHKRTLESTMEQVFQEPAPQRCDAKRMRLHGSRVEHNPARIGTRPCRYFNTPNGCKNGSACTFIHAPRASSWVSSHHQQPAVAVRSY